MRHAEYKIELFVFPDGTEVEMVVFDRARRARAASTAVSARKAPAQTRPTPAPSSTPSPAPEDPDAHRCPVCSSPFVYPVDWDRSGPSSWILMLRCPECETQREVTLGRASVEEFNRELYFGAQALAREADQMMRRNFEDEVQRIVAALERDLILPMDF
jgi:hypothetical protein